jgi:hypothetical protein
VTVLRGPASGSSLPAAPRQPVSGDLTNLQVVAAGTGRAYVTNPDNPAQSFATRDDGHAWQRIAPPCPGGAWGNELAVGGPNLTPSGIPASAGTAPAS